jgi:subtilisin family serine protease
MRKLATAAALAGLALALPAQSAGARFAVGVERGYSAERVASRLEARTGRPVSVIGPFAVAINAPSARGLATTPGVSFVERVDRQRRLAFVPNDPFASRQWYLDRVRAFDAWPKAPILPAVAVAIIDSGIDSQHPELEDRILEGKSFVRGAWDRDTNGHGTFVAGQIAAALNNGQGIAGMAFSAQLLVAKVVRSDNTISLEAEARAIRWAADNEASVINLSFGGVRDPRPGSSRDSYSPLEAAAVEYAVRKGALVVAAVGNADNAPVEPWSYASYPAALPHVLGVSAINRDGTVPNFSNRDKIHNDIAAPGEGIFSTLPRALTTPAVSRVTCVVPGYSDCGPPEFRRGEGTSFAAPQVSAAAALIMAESPLIRPDQVTTILERAAVDATPARGCRRCTPGRDDFTGWGVLDIASAVESLAGPLPDADTREPNDEAGKRSWRLVWGGPKGRRIAATINSWQDPIDVYRVRLRRGQRLRAALRGPRTANARLLLWKPGTKRVEGFTVDRRRLAARSPRGGFVKAIRYRAARTGWYYLQVKAGEGSGRYVLRFAKRPPRVTGSRATPPRQPRGSAGPGSPQRDFSALRP